MSLKNYKFNSRTSKAVIFIGLLIFLWISASFYFSISPQKVLTYSGKAFGYMVLSLADRQDTEQVQSQVRDYNVGLTRYSGTYPRTWNQLQALGVIRLSHMAPKASLIQDRPTPFVYENPNRPYLKNLKNAFRLSDIVSKEKEEFQQMLALSKWIGTRWDHGTDHLPGTPKNFDPVQVILEGEKGKKFWCEIAAELSVHAASALGWPARLVTLSRDGYTWEHAVAEYWSNQYNKWFVVDTDFNILYMAGGLPLSAFELCHQGQGLSRTGELKIVQFAPSKPSLPLRDLIPFYRYIHIDMRNDWHTRKLRKGSPAGGDLSTWWTARDNLLSILTIKKKVTSKVFFDWPLNFTRIHVLDATIDGPKLKFELGFSGYSPFFDHWQVSIDRMPWQTVSSTETILVEIGNGIHSIRARMYLIENNFGPETLICFSPIMQKQPQ